MITVSYYRIKVKKCSIKIVDRHVGLVVRKKTIAFCIRLIDGQIFEQGITCTNSQSL